MPIELADEIDIHWSAKGHHQHRSSEAVSVADKEFHLYWEERHLECMKHLILKADFTEGFDPIGKEMHFKKTWQQPWAPDEAAWDKLEPDENYPVGQSHPSDVILFVTQDSFKWAN